MDANTAVKKESARRTRRSFVVGAAAAAGAYGAYHYLNGAKMDALLGKPFRKALNFNADVSRMVFDERGNAPTYPVSRATELRVNGNYGLEKEILPESWRLQLVGVDQAKRFPQYVSDVTTWAYKYKEGPKKAEEASPKINPLFAKAFAEAAAAQGDQPLRGQDEAGLSDSTLDPGTAGLLLTMDDLDKLPRHELVTQFKCIEGWSQIVQWSGFRLADLMAAYPPARNAKGELPRYVYMETPDGNYYCGYDRTVCEHPQTLLATEMHGQPLTQDHGAPLRLHMPSKYGYKQIKRISLIAYTDEKPDDYWTKLGYDWYAGL
jgi:DMSO/TMAO reductase YedYZ molybdopterin-dependent catalytic subunit